MIQHITKPFKYFFKLEAASGLVLLFAAILALIISNGDFSEYYFSTLEKYIMGKVIEIGIAKNKGNSIESINVVEVVKGKGLVNDRHFKENNHHYNFHCL